MVKLYYIRKTNNELLNFGEFESALLACSYLADNSNSLPCGRYLTVERNFITQVSLKEKSGSLYIETDWEVDEGNILIK